MYANRARASSRHSDLEEGETFSSASRSSSRSASSYNPPLTVAADSDVISRAIESQQVEAPSPASRDPQPSVSAEQLRQRAQGALLSLKPHNIAYNELVAEGLNPSILKGLYEQVGLKVPSSSDKPSKTSDQPPKLVGERTAAVASANIDHNLPKPSNASPPSAPCPPSNQETETEKPLERKELIARKLAAQAAAARTAKVLGVESNTVAKDTQSTPTPSTSATQGDSDVKKTAVPVRQKSKAQTELARQRILELQRQALLKSQQKNQATQSSQVLQPENATEVSNAATSATQHPLPVRPPIPQPSRTASIPGLVMIDAEHSSSSQMPETVSPAIAMNPTPVPRPFQRKRPLASDFDEPETGFKKHIGYENESSGTDRLIIEISDDSDDESLYGDEDVDMDKDMDTGQGIEAPHFTHSALSRPPLPKYPSSISTPQGSSWQSDNEDMQRKNLEIQEMHRKIAILEEKRKAKAKLAASGIESPNAVGDSGKSSSLSSTESNPLETSQAPQIESNGNPATSVPRETSTAPQSAKSAADNNVPAVSNNSASSFGRSQSESSGSPMDESPDVSSPSQASFDDASAASGESNNVADQPTSAPSAKSVQFEREALASPSNVTKSINGESTHSSDSEDDESDQESSASMVHSVDDFNAAPGLPHPEQTLPTVNDDITMKDSTDQASPNDGFRREASAESDESEAYEPPEPENPADPESPYSPPPFSPASHVSVEENAENSLAILDDPPADETLTDAPLVPVSEYYPGSQAGILGSQGSTATAPSGSKFAPYISPLRQFKGYRYHQGFTTDVSNGYRSLTYSHDIDWEKTFCPYELAGGVCNDRSCDFQHFRDITLSDDKVLIEMGSVREGQTESEKEDYRAGLKEIINEMRRDKVKDFGTVASEIVAYRRRFLQDPSRVLPL